MSVYDLVTRLQLPAFPREVNDLQFLTTAASADIDGDGTRDVAHVVREGSLFVWEGNGASDCDAATWPEFGHDGWNTNNEETDASRGRSSVGHRSAKSTASTS